MQAEKERKRERESNQELVVNKRSWKQLDCLCNYNIINTNMPDRLGLHYMALHLG